MHTIPNNVTPYNLTPPPSRAAVGGGRALQGLGFGVWGLGFAVCGLRFAVWGLQFGVCSLGFVVWGLGFVFMVQPTPNLMLLPQPNAAYVAPT